MGYFRGRPAEKTRTQNPRIVFVASFTTATIQKNNLPPSDVPAMCSPPCIYMYLSHRISLQNGQNERTKTPLRAQHQLQSSLADGKVPCFFFRSDPGGFAMFRWGVSGMAGPKIKFFVS